MLFSYNWLKEYFKKIPNVSKTADFLINHSFEINSIKKRGKDIILDIAVLANRPDCLSQTGIAREINAITSQKITLPPIKKLKKFKTKGKRAKKTARRGKNSI